MGFAIGSLPLVPSNVRVACMKRKRGTEGASELCGHQTHTLLRKRAMSNKSAENVSNSLMPMTYMAMCRSMGAR